MGIVAVEYAGPAEVALIVEISPAADIERLPDETVRVKLLNHPLPLLRVAAFEPSAPVKVLLTLARAATQTN